MEMLWFHGVAIIFHILAGDTSARPADDFD
jgi:hypothetical protein